MTTKRNPYTKGVPRKIAGFHQDEHGDWIAELDCGHRQHVRHNPPWTLHEWVITSEERRAHLGHLLFCKRCAEEQWV